VFTASSVRRTRSSWARCSWWIRGFGVQQADADLAAVLVDALDHIPVELKLADDDGGEVNSGRAQLVERDRLVARAA
jgi:hypothetical protein